MYLQDIDEEKFLLRVMNNDVSKTKIFNINYELEEMSLSGNQNRRVMNGNRLKFQYKDKNIFNEDRFLRCGNSIINTISIYIQYIYAFLMF